MVNSLIKKIIGMPSNIWIKRKFDLPYTEIKSVDFELVGFCNLNCKGCNHFSPISEKGELSIEKFDKDINQLYSVLGDEIKSINLLGGEPLLHSNINQIMQIARTAFPDTRILILTNGLLLKNISDEFWNIARENKIDIEITKYPVKFDYEAVKKIGESKGVKVHFFGRSGYVQKTLFTLPIDIHGGQNEKESFERCYMARSCITMRDGNLYPCSYAAYMYRFNEYFNQTVPITENDYSNIYTDTKEQILNKIGNPIPLCAYCNTYKRTYGNKWEQSRKKIEEWT